MTAPKHPMQPLALDAHGVLRFKENKIVSHLLEVGQRNGCGLNELASMDFSQEDREQFAELIGYSLSGWGSLSYVSDESYAAAEALASGVLGDAKPKELVQRVLQLQSAVLGLQLTVANPAGAPPPAEVREATNRCATAMGAVVALVLDLPELSADGVPGTVKENDRG